MKGLFALIKNLILLPVKIVLFAITFPIKLIKILIKSISTLIKIIFKIIAFFLNPLVLLLGVGGAAAFVFSNEERRKKVLGMIGL